MAEHIQRSILFKAQQGGASREATMEVIAFNEGERKTRALKSLGLLWMIATVCVLIPVAHFVLVPGFLIAGVMVARRRWNTPEEGLSATGECPSCGQSVHLELEKSADLPQWRNCPECGAGLELRAMEGAR